MGLIDNQGAVGIVATMDTKSAEADFVAEIIMDCGRRVVFLDTGTSGAREQNPAELLESNAAAVKKCVDEQAASGEITAVLGIAGGKGSGVFAHVASDLPYGFPKLLVSSARPALLGELAAKSDIILYPTIVDFFGINSFTSRVLGNAARAIANLHYEPTQGGRERKIVAITAFGVTTPAVNRCVELLKQSDIDSIVFPANGTGGKKMEALIQAGEFDGVIDLTTTELADELLGGTASAGPGRLTSAGRKGIPQFIAPGAVDMVNFGARQTVPKSFEHRNLYSHTPYTTLMRTTREENEQIGRLAGERLASASGPTIVAWPARGVSDYDRDGGVFFDTNADEGWLKGLRDVLPETVPIIELDAHINDPDFSETAVNWLLQQLREEKHQ